MRHSVAFPSPRLPGWAGPAVLAALLVAGCATRQAPAPVTNSRPLPAQRPGTVPPPASSPPAASTALPGATPPAVAKPSPVPSGNATAQPLAPSPLAAESRWLRELFGGTPVVVADERDGAVVLSVPLTYSFDEASGPSSPKPPLRAVLDKVSMSLQRQSSASLQVAAPEPSANQRSAAMRNYVAAKGIATARIAVGSTDDDTVLLRLTPAR